MSAVYEALTKSLRGDYSAAPAASAAPPPPVRQGPLGGAAKTTSRPESAPSAADVARRKHRRRQEDAVRDGKRLDGSVTSAHMNRMKPVQMPKMPEIGACHRIRTCAPCCCSYNLLTGARSNTASRRPVCAD